MNNACGGGCRDLVMSACLADQKEKVWMLSIYKPIEQLKNTPPCPAAGISECSGTGWAAQ